SRYKGDHKRNDLAKPIIMNDSRIDLLRHYALWFEQWKNSSDFQHALSKQTFLALSATCNSLADLSEYLLHEKGLDYILLGKFQTDQLERRFGRYRQLHGGNYYISVRQLLQSEKKIKVSAALLHDKLNFQALSQISESSDSHVVEPLRVSVPNFDPESLSSTDKNIIAYIGGYIARSLRDMPCADCVKLLSTSDPLEFVDVHPNECALLFMRDRGGLRYPSDLVFLVVSVAFFFYENVKEKQDFCAIISSNYPVDVFVKTTSVFIESDSLLSSVKDSLCETGHTADRLINRILRSCFNIFLKNFVKILLSWLNFFS
ncbi:MAG: hypothetical protein AAGK05_18200, partial [Pseudomonadota bacterium]